MNLCVHFVGARMMALLFLQDEDLLKTKEICDLLENAGYKVKWNATPGLRTGPAGNEACGTVAILQVNQERPLPLHLASLAAGAVQPWRLSLRQRILVAPNQTQAKLTNLEFTLLKMFAMMEQSEVVSRKRIIDEFGEHYLSYDQNRLDTTVMRLRKKVIMLTGMTLPLNTVRVRGFSFDDWLILEH